MKWSTESSFTSNSDGVKISYASLVSDAAKTKPTISFFTGYKETYQKYLPLMNKLHTEEGFNIFTMDHRNQGLSGDTPGTTYEKGFEDSSGKRICYVEDFETAYVEDMKQFLETIVKPSCQDGNPSICVLTHSMGGLLAARLAQLTGKSLFDRMALSAPMISHKNILDIGGLFDLELPIGLASSFGALMVKMKQGPIKADGRDTDASKPTTELLTHSSEKLEAWHKLRKEYPQIVLGGASFQWAKAALEIEDNIMEDIEKIEVPTLVFMAENDAFVYNSAIVDFVGKLGKEKAMLIGPIANAYHELLQEKNDITSPILKTIGAFAALGSQEDEDFFPDSLLSEINSIPLSQTKFDENIYWPKGFHSCWKPPSIPTPLVLKNNPGTRYFVSTFLKGVALAAILRSTAVWKNTEK